MTVSIDAIVEWLTIDAPTLPGPEHVVHGFAQRLNDAGFDLLRCSLNVRPLSPQATALIYTWRPVERHSEVPIPTGESVVANDTIAFPGALLNVVGIGHGGLDRPAFVASPLYRLIVAGDAEVRCRITPGQTDVAFPIMRDLQAEGGTDYFAGALRLHGSGPSPFTFTTKRPGGFSDAHVTALRRSLVHFGLAIAPMIALYATRVLLGAYLGLKTGERILSGKVERGDVEEIDAAIWFSDLRGFTPMSSRIEARELIAWLNDYFSVVGRAITEHDGEILKFIGDAVLAVWPVTTGRPREATCRAALAAARAANAGLDALNASRAARGLSPLEHGIGLHVGAAQYGNIGAEGRLDFTVIGPAVNTAARLEGTCSKIERRLVASSEFASAVGDSLVRAGDVELKGLEGRHPIYTDVDSGRV